MVVMMIMMIIWHVLITVFLSMNLKCIRSTLCICKISVDSYKIFDMVFQKKSGVASAALLSGAELENLPSFGLFIMLFIVQK